MKFAIIGATGNVGRKTIEILDKSNLKIDDLFLVASTKSAGKKFLFRKRILFKNFSFKHSYSENLIIKEIGCIINLT